MKGDIYGRKVGGDGENKKIENIQKIDIIEQKKTRTITINMYI